MPWIGIDTDQGLVFEGPFGYGNAVLPTPTTAPAAIVSAADFRPKLPSRNNLAQAEIVFREDSFDAVQLMRRGRLYFASQSRPCEWDVHDARGRSRRSVYPFQPLYVPTKIKDIEQRGEQPLGIDESSSIWSIVSMEGSSSGEFLLTLSGRQTFGALPELKVDAIPPAHRRAVQDAVSTLREDIYRAGPTSVIDRARDAASAALSAYLQDLGVVRPGRELVELIEKLDGVEAAKKKHVAVSTAEIVRIFHSRAKPSVQERFTFRSIHEQDARLAIACVATLLCELGWAEWP